MEAAAASWICARTRKRWKRKGKGKRRLRLRFYSAWRRGINGRGDVVEGLRFLRRPSAISAFWYTAAVWGPHTRETVESARDPCVWSMGPRHQQGEIRARNSHVRLTLRSRVSAPVSSLGRGISARVVNVGRSPRFRPTRLKRISLF